MVKNRQSLQEAIQEYNALTVEEIKSKALFLELLQNKDAFQRYHMPGHITGSAWIVNKKYSKTLLVLHAKLGRWLQPGGHCEGEENVLNVALREAEEETGVQHFEVAETSPFDIDVHPIPARKDFPAHDHYDIRFLVIANDEDTLLISDESTDLRWFALEDIKELTDNNPSVMRMVEKTHKAADNQLKSN